MNTFGDYLGGIIFVALFVFVARKIWDSTQDLMTNIARIGITAAIIFTLIFFGFKFLTTHWFIAALVIGAVIYFVKDQQIQKAIGAAVLSAVILLVGGHLIPDRYKDSPAQQRNYRNEERQYEERIEELQRMEELQRQYEEEQRHKQELENERRQRDEQQRQEALRRQREQQQRQKEKFLQKMAKLQENEKNSEVGRVFFEYYKAISDHRFEDAYNLLTPNAQHFQGTLEYFATSRKDTMYIEILYFSRLNVGNSEIEGNYIIITRDKTLEGVKEQTFEGNVTFVKDNGRWLIDSQNSQHVVLAAYKEGTMNFYVLPKTFKKHDAEHFSVDVKIAYPEGSGSRSPVYTGKLSWDYAKYDFQLSNGEWLYKSNQMGQYSSIEKFEVAKKIWEYCYKNLI